LVEKKLEKLVDVVFPLPRRRVGSIIEGPNERILKFNHRVSISGFLSQEVPLSKGENQYKKTIGFIDAIIRVEECLNAQVEIGTLRENCPSYSASRKDFTFEISKNVENFMQIYIEAKVTQENAANILRQIKLYPRRKILKRAECDWLFIG
jgi:hypothetical protein